MKITKYLFLFMILGICACEDQWDDHYKDSEIRGNVQPVSNENVLDYLKSKPEFSQFVQAIEEDTSGLAKELRADQLLTVWALDNNAMANLEAVMAETNLSKSFILRFHINNLSYGQSKLKRGLRLISLNGKYIPVSLGADGEPMVTGTEIVQGDLFCANGVVHAISDVMRPQLSIYEYISALGDDYSIIRDTLLALNEVVFDPEASLPIGVDTTGNTIYDSTFVVRNDILDSVGVTSEFLQSTMFVPSNAVIEAAFEELIQVKPDITIEDTLRAFNWIKRAIFVDEVVEDYGVVQDVISAFGNVWRTTVQDVAAEPIIMSNGLVYEVEYLHIPNNVMLSRFKELVSYYEFLPDDKKTELFTFTGATTFSVRTADNVTFNHPDAPATWTYKILQVEGDASDGVPAAVEFTAIRRVTLENGTTSAEAALIPPGEYNFYMGFQSKNHPYVNFYFNGELVLENQNVSPSTPWNYDRVNNTVPGTKWNGDGGLVGIVNVTGEGPQPFTIKVEFSQPQADVTTEIMKLYHWSLRASEDNY